MHAFHKRSLRFTRHMPDVQRADMAMRMTAPIPLKWIWAGPSPGPLSQICLYPTQLVTPETQSPAVRLPRETRKWYHGLISPLVRRASPACTQKRRSVARPRTPHLLLPWCAAYWGTLTSSTGALSAIVASPGSGRAADLRFGAEQGIPRTSASSSEHGNCGPR